MEKNEKKLELTKNEKVFCELFVNGCAPYAGNAGKCYDEAFNTTSNTSNGKARELLNCEHIQQYIEELEHVTYEEAKFLKKRLTENLLKIIDETSTDTYMDRRGTKLSPAPLRSVAVQASKALMEMYPIKEAQKLNIEGTGEGGIVFNVIVPENKKIVNNEESD